MIQKRDTRLHQNHHSGFIPLLIFFVLMIKVNGQEVFVLDAETKAPLPDVNIFNDVRGTTTNHNGICTLDDFDSSSVITFSLIGYKILNLSKSTIPGRLYLENSLITFDRINVVAKNKSYRKKFHRLERDVKRVYPYAKTLSALLEEYEQIIDSLDYYSGLSRYYRRAKIFSQIEDELVLKYGHSMRKLTRNQGRILVRLIDRETNRTSYDIIKEFRNIFVAGFWQITARVFGHDLRYNYNPKTGEDRLIEFIIKRLDIRSG